jgi:hypothetical protein
MSSNQITEISLKNHANPRPSPHTEHRLADSYCLHLTIPCDECPLLPPQCIIHHVNFLIDHLPPTHCNPIEPNGRLFSGGR